MLRFCSGFSLGDISPNMIMDAIRYNRPFIVTRETGIYDRIKDIAIFVDPENTEDIAEKIVWLSQPENYEKQKEKYAISLLLTHGRVSPRKLLI